MIKKAVKSTMLIILIAGAMNIASAQEKPNAVKLTPSYGATKKKEGGNHGQLFDKLDLDKNGSISKDEASKSNNPRFSDNFDQMDTNKDGNVSRTELKVFRPKGKQTSSNQQGKDRKAPMDANKDGKISRDEAGKSDSKYFINNFDKLDTNKDGFIDKNEKQVARETRKATKTTLKKSDK